MNCTATGSVVQKLRDHVEEMLLTLEAYVKTEPRKLDEIEQKVMGSLKGIGSEIVSALCTELVARYPEPEVGCKCGGVSNYCRNRVGKCKGLFGWIEYSRAYYLCDGCHRGMYPSDELLEFCPGGISQGLDEILAMMGAEFPFEEASKVVEKLTLVEISGTRCRKSTEGLGKVIEESEEEERHLAWEASQLQLPEVEGEAEKTLYISADGVTTHIREHGWREMRLGALYSTSSRPHPKKPDKNVIRTRDSTFIADIVDVDGFAQLLYLEAHRRAIDEAEQVVFIGDGAHWIWRIAEEYFPSAIQILDWYHVTEYIWAVANDIYGGDNDISKAWAKKQLKRLAESKTDLVLDEIRAFPSTSKPAQDALTYFSNHRQRMDYRRYRQLGLQIGSGTIESGCNHVIGARLKGAGMRWELNAARYVAKVRSRLRGQRWDDTIALRPPPQRATAA